MKSFLIIVISITIGLTAGWLIFGTPYSNNMNEATTEHSDHTEIDPNQIVIDPTVVQTIGVRLDTARTKRLTTTFRVVGKIEVNETKLQSINSKITGWVEKLYVDFSGQLVKEGQPLLDIYSPDLVSTQEEYLQALDHEKKMDSSISDDAKKDAFSLANSVKRRLKNWDVSENDIELLAKTKQVKKTLTLYAPTNGFIIEKSVIQGQNITSGIELYKIADLSTLWVMAEINENDLQWIRIAQEASVKLSYTDAATIKGKISWVQPLLNETTRTGTIRIEIPNTSKFEIKPGMFASVELYNEAKKSSVVVENQSVIKTGERNILIVSKGNGVFDPREVTLGLSNNDQTEIISGIKENEQYVVSSQFLIDSESNIKAAINQLLSHTHVTENNSNISPTKVKSRKVVWVCPMHPEIVRPEPGSCPLCKMDLVKKEI